MVQPQAMACGLPIIATTNTGSEDLFTDGIEGFIVPVRSPEAIRTRVLKLYNDPAFRDEMSRAAIRRIQSSSGWNEYGRGPNPFTSKRCPQRSGCATASL